LFTSSAILFSKASFNFLAPICASNESCDKGPGVPVGFDELKISKDYILNKGN